MLLILIQGLNCIRLFRRYKNEQKAELQQEREQIEAQRAESMKMLQELQALKHKCHRNMCLLIQKTKQKQRTRMKIRHRILTRSTVQQIPMPSHLIIILRKNDKRTNTPLMKERCNNGTFQSASHEISH